MWKTLLVWLLFHHRTEHTNATFWRRATKQRRATDQRPWAWHWLPGYQKLLWKLGTVLVTVMALWLAVFDWDALVELFWLGVAAGAVAVALTGWKWWNRRKHSREVVTPLRDALTDILGEAA